MALVQAAGQELHQSLGPHCATVFTMLRLMMMMVPWCLDSSVCELAGLKITSQFAHVWKKSVYDIWRGDDLFSSSSRFLGTSG
jgi:hypothetical protein